MIETLASIDQSLLLYLNGFHNTFGDYFMSTFTSKWIWVPMYASILYILLRNYNWKVVLGCLVAIALTITFADQVCATVIRPVVERMRPSNPDNPISEWVHIVNGKRGGRYGFPSCHASNSFGLAFFLVFLFRKRWLSFFICAWAALNCYTRIYLGVHYPGDLLVGSIIGCCGAYLMYYLLRQFTKGTDFHAAKHTEATIYVGLLTTIGILIYAAIMTAA
ncbi:phosphatase PAP2 family protein [Bacteroides sp.]